MRGTIKIPVRIYYGEPGFLELIKKLLTAGKRMFTGDLQPVHPPVWLQVIVIPVEIYAFEGPFNPGTHLHRVPAVGMHQEHFNFSLV